MIRFITTRATILLTILASVGVSAKAGTILLEGNYHGKNLYVQNPFASEGVGFCTFEVKVNGQVTTDEINSSAFEIDLSFFQLALGSPVEIRISHKDDCKPKVVNPEVLKPMSTFEVASLGITKEGQLKMTTTNETGKLPYVIEQFRWNKWVEVGEFEGKGDPEKNNYEIQLTTVHSGPNRFRVKQVDHRSKPRYSFEAKVTSPLPEVTFQPGDGKKVTDAINFSSATLYEIYNAYGNIVAKGVDKRVDVSGLEKGTYYLNYGIQTATFKK
ncbi:MAG: hypothetical protein H6601_08050 [Flavobacteriales bacterium]|nr:hypothetical protein [Flavobacteriales bacterium]